MVLVSGGCLGLLSTDGMSHCVRNWAPRRMIVHSVVLVNQNRLYCVVYSEKRYSVVTQVFSSSN